MQSLLSNLRILLYESSHNLWAAMIEILPQQSWYIRQRILYKLWHIIVKPVSIQSCRDLAKEMSLAVLLTTYLHIENCLLDTHWDLIGLQMTDIIYNIKEESKMSFL